MAKRVCALLEFPAVSLHLLDADTHKILEYVARSHVVVYDPFGSLRTLMASTAAAPS